MGKDMDLDEQYDKIYRYCYFRMYQREAAEDITQETFLRFLENGTFRNTGRQLQYLYTIARNLCIDAYRNEKKRELPAGFSEETETGRGMRISEGAGEENPEEGLVASRFGLKSAILARMAVLGMLHAVILCLVALFVHGERDSVFRAGIYLLVPYLLTDTATLWLCRRIRGREVIYAGAGVAVMVGFLPLLARYTGGWLQQDGMFRGWAVSTVLLCFTAVSEWKKSIGRTEELAWN